MSLYQLSRTITLTAYLGLYLVYGLWCWWFGPDQLAAAAVLWLLVCSGLLVVLPGVVKGRRRSYQWLCFIFLIYFVDAVLKLFELAAIDSPSLQESLVAYLRMLLVVAGFIAGMFAVRWYPAVSIHERG